MINSLKRARVAQVGNTPGVTKALQEIHLDKNIKLIDCPGIVFTAGTGDAASALRNCVKVSLLVPAVRSLVLSRSGGPPLPWKAPFALCLGTGSVIVFA